MAGVGTPEPGVVLPVSGAWRGNLAPWEDTFVTVLGDDRNEEKEGVLAPEATGDGERFALVVVAALDFDPNQS